MQPTIDDADFSLEIRQIGPGEKATVRVAGDVDLTTADELQRVVRAQMEAGPVLLDLSAVSFMDSSGLRVLDDLVRHSRAGGGDLWVDRDLPDSVAQILELTGLMQVLPLADS